VGATHFAGFVLGDFVLGVLFAVFALAVGAPLGCQLEFHALCVGPADS
jgi:hypothetical protein